LFSFEKLKIYQDAIRLIAELNAVADRFPEKERWGLASQLRRAAVSVALNIAEGSARTKKDNINFLRFARGSVFEIVAILQVVKTMQYVENDRYQELYDACEVLSKQISSYTKVLTDKNNAI